jgi:hypothetical protein
LSTAEFELESKWRRHVDRPRTRWFSRYLNISRRIQLARSRKVRSVRRKVIGDIDSYKTEIVLGEKDVKKSPNSSRCTNHATP